jgi:hypothetical protein
MLAMAGATVLLASAACGEPVAGAPPVPTPTPVTGESIAAAVGNSTMDNAHFRLFGNLVHKPTYYPVTGDGILQLRPVEALQMNLNVQTFSSLGVLKIQEIAVGTRLYMRVGTGKWSAKRESASATTPTSYVGEEIMYGNAVWHARSTSGSSSYDIWVRESDGYITQLVYATTSGKLTMVFNLYNKSRPIVIPAVK